MKKKTFFSIYLEKQKFCYSLPRLKFCASKLKQAEVWVI